ncbi:hypothetical protein HNQ59_003902 [Chitinivorax tropicus]|uniref:Uncharacterized protein n=1 Tax=Chitinivorax tropicus TaxID=714531 RepID=A0A840MZL4_9PROT|nr:hypothetical protein [Chitinivorax tropicus]MBB5020581.1 hypothetical protein [Chitinivorax tropicus]
MSSLSIWDPSRQGPKPQTFDEVLAQFRQLSGQADQPNYWFASFAQHIQNVVNSQPQVPQEWRDRYGHFVARAPNAEGEAWLDAFSSLFAPIVKQRERAERPTIIDQ